MKNRGRTVVLSLAATMLLSTSLLGCAGKSSHAQAVEGANKRWHSLRSAALLDMAKSQFEAGSLDQAEKTVNDAAAIDADNPALHLMAGRIALERGQLERAFRLFELSAELAPNHSDTFYFQGVVLQRWHQYDAALTAYQRAYQLKADDASRLLAVTETMVELNRVDEAIALLEEKKHYFDQNAGVRAMLGHLYQMKGEPRLAVENFRQAMMLDQENLRLHEELAFAQVNAQFFSDAVITLEGIVERREFEGREDLKRSLAQAYAGVGRFESAKKVYVELTRRNPSAENDWIRLGELCWQIDDTGGTLIAANRVIMLAPQRYEGYLMAGMVWQKRGRVEDALKNFDRAADLAPDNPTPLILRGLALQKSDRKAAAAEAYAEALRRAPDDHRAERLLATVSTP